jgi:hypothetical protein
MQVIYCSQNIYGNCRRYFPEWDMFGSAAKSTALDPESHSVSKLIMRVQNAD